MTDVASGGPWSLADMPDQTGRTAVVTGPTSGIGEHVSLELARRGARVVLGGRNETKLHATAARIRTQVPRAVLEQLVVDLADLTSVRRAGSVAAELGPVDLMVNNAGIMAPPYARTENGLERQMATNHFGPFLLTGLLLPQLTASGGGRVVTVSSSMHTLARHAPLDDPRVPRKHYLRWPEYGESKLANLLFTTELDRRARLAGLPLTALAAHPGFSATHLAANGRFGRESGGLASVLNGAVAAVAQSAHAGALPVLMAATADLPGNTYCGPGGRGGMRGAPVVVGRSAMAHDTRAARQLWEISEETVDLNWP